MTGYPLDPSPEQMRAMGEAAIEYVIGFIHGLDDAPPATSTAPSRRPAARRSPPEEGGSFDEVFAEFRDAAARAYETCGPGYLPYIPGGGLYSSALGQFLAMSVNRFPTCGRSPRARADRAERDPVALRPVRIPGGRARILTTGGSIANLSRS